MQNPNLALLEDAVRLLQPLLDELVFVGGGRGTDPRVQQPLVRARVGLGAARDDRRAGGSSHHRRPVRRHQAGGVPRPREDGLEVTQERWKLITTVKHPVMAGRAGDVRTVLENPDEIRESRSDRHVRLFYRADGADRWICAVAKQVARDGFLITAYPTDAIKEGTRIWPK